MNSPVVLITGALTGIGRATALFVAKKGYTVVVSGRKSDAGLALESELKAIGAQAAFIAADVRREEDVCALLDSTVERFGRVDAAVNNAGTEGVPGPIIDQSAELYAASFDTNVLGTLLSMKHELRIMQKQRSGSIVNISSSLGHKGAAGASVYSASKHAVEGLTKSGALEGAPFNIRVNAVSPGPIDTGMLSRWTGTEEQKENFVSSAVPLKRAGHPEEVARAIAFLISDQAAFSTGQIFGVDGGQDAH